MAGKMNYISFKGVANGRKLYDLIKQHSIKATIVPTLKVLDMYCGISILYDNLEDEPKIGKTIREDNTEIRGFHEIERDTNLNRMRFL